MTLTFVSTNQRVSSSNAQSTVSKTKYTTYKMN